MSALGDVLRALAPVLDELTDGWFAGMEIDLVLAGSGLESLALSRADRVAVAEVEVSVVSATDLFVLKVLAGRGKDIDDARSVLASGAVDVQDARSLLEQLEEALSVSDLVPRLEAMLDRKE